MAENCWYIYIYIYMGGAGGAEGKQGVRGAGAMQGQGAWKVARVQEPMCALAERKGWRQKRFSFEVHGYIYIYIYMQSKSPSSSPSSIFVALPLIAHDFCNQNIKKLGSTPRPGATGSTPRAGASIWAGATISCILPRAVKSTTYKLELHNAWKSMLNLDICMAFRIHNPNANDMKWLVFIPTAEMRRRAKDHARAKDKKNKYIFETI